VPEDPTCMMQPMDGDAAEGKDGMGMGGMNGGKGDREMMDNDGGKGDGDNWDSKVMEANITFLMTAFGIALGSGLQLFRYRSDADYYNVSSGITSTNWWEMGN